MNPANPTASVERRFLVDAFLKKTTRWPTRNTSGPSISSPSQPARRRFSDDVLKRSVAAVKSYWQQMVFSGQTSRRRSSTATSRSSSSCCEPGRRRICLASANIDGAKVLSVR